MSLKRRLPADDPAFSPQQTKCCEEPSQLLKRLRVSPLPPGHQEAQPSAAPGPVTDHGPVPFGVYANPPGDQQVANFSGSAMKLQQEQEQESLCQRMVKAGEQWTLSEMNSLLRQLHFERLQRLAGPQHGALDAVT